MSEANSVRSHVIDLCQQADSAFAAWRLVAFGPNPVPFRQRLMDAFEAAAEAQLGSPDDVIAFIATDLRRTDPEGRFNEAAYEAARPFSAVVKELNEIVEESLKGVHRGDTSQLEPAIAYLEADPWHFHSGYFKQKLMRALRRVPLNDEHRERLRVAILGTVTKGRRQEQNEVRALARRLDTPAFREALATIATEHPDEATRERAEMTLAACQLNDVHHDLRGAVNRSASST